MAIVRLKLLTILLIVTVFGAGCEIPDLTEFTKQSAEMTRGIRTGVKDTEGVIKTASERNDLFSDKSRSKFRQELKSYHEGLKPTLEALDGLDAYLDALNALAQAKKKSTENSKAVVNAVSGLITAVSGFTFAGPALNVATGLLKLETDFRITHDFKKRVNLASIIVEGGYKEKIGGDGKPVLDPKGKTILVKACAGDAEIEITTKAKEIKTRMTTAMQGLTDVELKELEPLTPEKKRTKLREWNKLDDAQVTELTKLEEAIDSYSCGVIDLIKFNVKDLKQINLEVSRLMLTNAKQKNITVLGFYQAIEATDRKVQRELETILNYRTLAARIRELEATDSDKQSIRDARLLLKSHATQLFTDDAQICNKISQELSQCGSACGTMQEFFDGDMTCEKCEEKFVATIDKIKKPEFDTSNGRIDPILEERAAKLYEQNTMFLEELKRITPAHSLVIADLKSITDKQNQLDKLHETSMSALDAWAKSHANLRVAVNTKKPLGVAQLASKVREIWSIINPTETTGGK